MKSVRFWLILLQALSFAVCLPLVAQHISFAGVLGNSGEQGSSLVRFAPAPAHGLGVIYDSSGTIWDRAGTGRLNRYAVDGRLLASYPIAPGGSQFDRHTLAHQNIVLLLGGNLYRLSIDAPPGTQPTSLGISADQISPANANGDIAVLQRNTVKVLNTNNWTLNPVIQNLAIGSIYSLAMLDDGSILFRNAQQISLFRNGTEVTQGWPKIVIPFFLQHIGGFWYGFAYHGTIHRFDDEFQPAPGVVLGGKSGSVLGRVDENDDLLLGSGMAVLGDAAAAVSGRYGIVSLLEWDQGTQQYRIARRLGSVTNCLGLALNDNGSVWFNWGRWNWNDLPAAPILDSVGVLDSFGSGTLGQIVPLNDGSFLAAVQRSTTLTILRGTFDWKLQLANGISLPSAMLNAATMYTQKDGKRVFLVADASGHASAFPMGANNMPQQSAVPVSFHFASSVHQLTTLAMQSDSVMLAAVDGAIAEFQLQGDVWQEIHRWNNWGTGEGEHFGSQVYLVTDGAQLWVSDSSRHRVLCFDLQTRKFLGSFGQVDQSGDDLGHLSHPAAIAARSGRAVVFDSDNQRLVKLQFSGS
jgi:hypothetical protein